MRDDWKLAGRGVRTERGPVWAPVAGALLGVLRALPRFWLSAPSVIAARALQSDGWRFFAAAFAQNGGMGRRSADVILSEANHWSLRRTHLI
jgi:hypothetical protein